ncbi:MAG: TonB-dependent receptor [Acidobacteria bacterium]|nr:TonB-dependent receptor [Acidobacteriota bacterium]
MPRRRLAWVALLVIGSAPLARGEAEPAPPATGDPSRPRLVDQVTVTATRGDTRTGDNPASVAVVDRTTLDVTAAPTVDDALRQVVGFGLFRRLGSRTANPTVQGVSLRGLGASGASRALVLVDGLPLNDPFGGWVYWGRVPRLGVERLEALRGGSSDLYGSGALGGVAQIVSRRPGPGRGLEAETSAGGSGHVDGVVTAHAGGGAWSGRVSIQALHTDGHQAVDPSDRGSVDRPVASRHVAVDATTERRVGGDGRLFLRAMYYDEARENGTPLQENDTGIGLAAAGFDRGPWSLRLWGSSQELRQAFSAVAPDRGTERLTRLQRVPADAAGLSGQWSRALGGHNHLVAGLEGRRVSGSTHETGSIGGAATSELDAGGTQLSAAAFVSDRFQAHPRWLLTAAGRLDVWAQRDGHSFLTPLVATVDTAESRFTNRSETALSPRLGVLFRASSVVALSASAYGAFRGPTLNELYRGFRVGQTVTRANPALVAERLWGGELGALLARGPLALRLTVFDAEVRDAVANVTVETTGSLVTRQRRNLGRVRSTGLEVEAEARAGARSTVTAGYTLIDSRVRSFAADPTLEGRKLPHIPRHQAVLQARYDSDWRLGLQARWVGDAWEDDRNTLVLDSAFLLDLFVARRIASGLEVFAAAENLLDADVVVGRTPVRKLGAPRMIRGGLRFRAGVR